MNTRARLGVVALIASVAVAISGSALLGARAQDRGRRGKKAAMTSTIAFISTRHAPPPVESPLHASQVYLIDGDGSNVRRLTENAHMDNFPALSPDGRRIVFESNLLRAEGDPRQHLIPVPDEHGRLRADAARAGQLRNLVTRRQADRVPPACGRPRPVPALHD